jgi:hypothetical protein
MRSLILASLLIIACISLHFNDSKPGLRLLVVANEYKDYSLITQLNPQRKDSLFPLIHYEEFQWTIQLCTPQARNDTEFIHFKFDSLQFSDANQALSPHGDQLYKLYVKDMAAYLDIEAGQPIGQVLVKETWNVEEVPLYKRTEVGAVQSMKDSLWYRPSTLSKLFIMYKEEPSVENDEGWVYGIVDVENGGAPQILDKGNISSCIACHRGTKYDRMFGPK